MTQTSDNKRATLELGTKPVGRLLLQYALPAIIAMTATSLYNMVDSIFIGQGVGALAISGLAITFPFMNISIAFGAAVGVGASTCLSVRLGQRDYGTAQRILGNTVLLNLIIGIVFSALALLFLDPVLYFFGATENTIVYAREYMVVILLGNVITHQYFGLNALLRAIGKPKMAMYTTIFTVVLNIILDAVFIYVLDMGIRGVAIATILSQSLALCWQLKLFSNRNELVHFERRSLRLDGRIVKDIISIGISPFSMNACACLIVILINTALVRHGGDLAVGAYGIANRLGFFFFMAVLGINQGMQPIAGYNYGSEQYSRMFRVLRLAIYSGIAVMTVGWLISEFLTYPCVRLFTHDDQLTDIAVHGIRINSIAFPLIGFQAVVTNFFQSIGKAKISIFLSLSRQLIFLLPPLIIFPTIMKVDGVWWSLPTSDVLAFITTWIIMARFMRKFKENNPNVA